MHQLFGFSRNIQCYPTARAVLVMVVTREDVLGRLRKVRILYACEGGCRAHGLNDDGSDYDVRFLFVGADTRCGTLMNYRGGVDTDNDGPFSGWDLRKALLLLYAMSILRY